MGAESAIPSKDSVTANVDAVVCQRFFNAVVSVVKRRWPTRGQHKCYILRVLRAHGLCDSALHTIYRSVVVAKLLYASSAWDGFASATDRNKIQSFINKSKRNGYCSPDLPGFNNLCTSMKVDLFNKVLKIPIHVLHPLLPPPVSHTQRYGLRPTVHDRTLPGRSSNLVDCNFIIRMLCLNAY